MVTDYVFPQMDDIQAEQGLVCVFFQQDGASPHYSNHVYVAFNTRFPGRWIGRAGPNSVSKKSRFNSAGLFFFRST